MTFRSPFFYGGADKALNNRFSCYLQNGLSLSLCLSLSMPHRDIYWSLELMTFILSSLPACLLCLHIIIPLSPRVLFSHLCLNTLITQFIHLYTDKHLCLSVFIYLYIYYFMSLMSSIYFWGINGPRCSDSTLSKDSTVRAYSRIIIEMIEIGCGPLRIMLYFFQ